MSIDIEFNKITRSKNSSEIGEWLDANLPNPPLPETQRWTLGDSVDGRTGFRFENEEDATLFLMRWS